MFAPVIPDWPVPAHVRALTTPRSGGVSVGAYASLNLAQHVGDDPAHVAENRRLLRIAADLPGEPVWLNQVHGTQVVRLDPAATVVPQVPTTLTPPTADGAWSRERGVVCAVLTADCLPILLCDRAGREVAALHAGWRGLAAGVIENGVNSLDALPSGLLAWLGPALGPTAFEVGPEVRHGFMQHDAAAAAAFVPSPRSPGAGRWLADLYLLARQRLARLGVTRVYGGGECTWQDHARFYSYRREATCGRMATLIWMT